MLIGLIIVLNTVAAFAFLIYNRKKRHISLLAILFLAMPLFGFILYAVCKAVWKKDKTHYDREYLVRRLKIERGQSRPDVEEELNLIPVEDAMAMGANAEKRNLLLNQLKKSVHSNYRNILAAEKDKDTESAHYVAAAKMEVYNELYKQVKQAEKESKKDSKDILKAITLLDKLDELINSGILSYGEQNIYRERYCRLFEEIAPKHDDLDKEEYYGKFIEYLVKLEQFKKAEAVFTSMAEEEKNERSYFYILNMYYKLNRREQFFHELDALCSSRITLSSEGVTMVRYWLSQKENQKDAGKQEDLECYH